MTTTTATTTTPADVAAKIGRALRHYDETGADAEWARRGLRDWIAQYSVPELRAYAKDPVVGLNVNLPANYRRAEVVAYIVGAVIDPEEAS